MRNLYLALLLCIISMPLLAETQFNPPGCEYRIIFPGNPEEYLLHKATADGSTIPLYGAELTTTKSLIRAECASAGGNDLSIFNEENIIEYMKQLSFDNGLSRSSYNVIKNNLGIVGEVTGFKDTERGRMTARFVNYIGASSILTTYVISLSKDFQTNEMITFTNSVVRTKQ